MRGADAKAHLRSIDNQNVKPYIHPVTLIFANARFKIYKLLGIEPNYFAQRHRYSLDDRRLLDHMYILQVEQARKQQPGEKLLPADAIRYRYMKRKYSVESKINPVWIMVSGRSSKQCIFVWHEDFDRYTELSGIIK